MSLPDITKISKIYDHLLAQMASALPKHLELSDPEELDESLPAELAQGIGVSIGQGEHPERCLSDQEYFYQREFTLIVTRDVTHLMGDAKSRKERWKLILEDLHLVLQKLTGQHTIVNGTEVISFKMAYTRDSGPRATVINNVPYAFIELTVSAEYRERTT